MLPYNRSVAGYIRIGHNRHHLSSFRIDRPSLPGTLCHRLHNNTWNNDFHLRCSLIYFTYFNFILAFVNRECHKLILELDSIRVIVFYAMVLWYSGCLNMKFA